MNKEQKGQILTDCIKFVKLPKIVTIAIKATSKLPNKKLYRFASCISYTTFGYLFSFM